MAEPVEPVMEVAAGLLFRDGRLLITQRRASDHLGGLWEFPGGKREPHETYAECLRRELREELGVEVEVRERLAGVEHAYPEKRVRLEFFTCRLLAGEPKPIGCQALAWVTRAELGNFAFPAADAQLLERLRTDDACWT